VTLLELLNAVRDRSGAVDVFDVANAVEVSTFVKQWRTGKTQSVQIILSGKPGIVERFREALGDE
jgi:hypothetical protein